MFSVSQLSDEQKRKIEHWAQEGAQLAEIQKRMGEELGVTISYMDTRFLVLDLGLELRREEVVEEPEVVDMVVATGEVTATVDEVVRPGALKSGRVEFSDGEKALWAIDQMGRLSVDADTAGYQPDEDDLITFQEKLRDMLA